MHGDRPHAGIPMTTSPNFAEHQSDQTAGHPAAPHNGETNGNGHDKFVDANARSTERRRRPPPSPEEYIHALPALTPLNRLPIPMLATGLDGVVVYTNPAFATMLGHQPDTITLTGRRLPELLAGHSALYLVADRLLTIGVDAFGDVDVEPAGGNDAAVGIGDRIAHDHHVAYLPGGRADSVPATERSHRLLQQTLDAGQVVGMLVTRDEFGGRLDFTRLIAVHTCDGV
jgi:PAS domain-containing protein